MDHGPVSAGGTRLLRLAADDVSNLKSNAVAYQSEPPGSVEVVIVNVAGVSPPSVENVSVYVIGEVAPSKAASVKPNETAPAEFDSPKKQIRPTTIAIMPLKALIVSFPPSTRGLITIPPRVGDPNSAHKLASLVPGHTSGKSH